MNIKDFLTYIYPKTLEFKAAYHGLINPPRPITLTFSVTNKCQSRCKTCNIWKIYHENLYDPKDELSIEEIDRIFRSIGHIYFFNLSGGEPFLRNDLSKIVESALEYLKPAIIHSPTNAIASNRVIEQTKTILDLIKSKGLETIVTIKPSLDGIGKLHDEIRGVPGNWEKLMSTIEGIKKLENQYDNLHLEIGTVVSNFNKHKLDEIEDFVHKMGVQSYRNEIAEQREEFLNMGEPITPTAEEYAQLMRTFSDKLKKNLKNKRHLAKVTESLRLTYYDLASKIVKENRQIIPCYAGISNAHLTPYGDIWPCCVLGYSKPMGNLRDHGYDFQGVWNSAQAKEVRQFIKEKRCACPLANQAYSNLICNTNSLLKILLNLKSIYL